MVETATAAGARFESLGKQKLLVRTRFIPLSDNVRHRWLY